MPLPDTIAEATRQPTDNSFLIKQQVDQLVKRFFDILERNSKGVALCMLLATMSCIRVRVSVRFQQLYKGEMVTIP